MNKQTFPYRSIPVILLLGLILVSYTHCIHPEGGKKSGLRFASDNQTVEESNSNPDRSPSNSNNSPSINPAGFNEVPISRDAYRETVYPLLRARCILCHEGIQQPLHASNNTNNAHDVARPLVNFNNIRASRLVAKLRGERHNCWMVSNRVDCEDNARELEDKIEQWRDLIDQARQEFIAQNPDSVSSGSANANTRRTAESLSFEQELNRASLGSLTTVVLPLESANLGAPMTRSTINGEVVIGTPSNSFNVTLANYAQAGTATFNFTVRRDDEYRLWARARRTNASGSFYVNFNNRPFTYEWFIPNQNFDWVELTHSEHRLNVIVSLDEDRSNRLEIRQRTAGTQVTNLILSSDPSFDPRSQAVATNATMRFDLSPIVGSSNVWFEVDVEDFNAHAYRFFNPRLINQSGSAIRLEGIHIAVNGTISSQHATYSLVSGTFAQGMHTLSTSSMIVLKDRGPNTDRFSFEFNVLERVP
jgi:hypothetical protein